MNAAAADYLELAKPRLTALVLMTTASGFWLGLREPMPWLRFWCTVGSTALVVGGANALNQWMERDVDGLMRRTAHRPLPAGRLSPQEACRCGLALVVVGLVGLASTVNPLSAVLAFGAVLIYLLGYTPMKRASGLCTLVGAIPGALPPVIGWAGARGTVEPAAWALFALLFLWQLPHFLAIAVLYRDDYARAGFKMLPVIEPSGSATARQMVLYGLALLPVSLAPSLMRVTGAVSFYGALALGLVFAWLALRSALTRSRQRARELFLGSVLYLPLLMALLGWDKCAAAGVGRAATFSSTTPRHATSPLAIFGRVPRFSLVDQDGHPLTREELEGSVWIADFIFTRCAGQCPLMCAQIASLRDTFAAVDAIRFVSFSVDPSYDTPAVLAAYAHRYGATAPRWRFATGSSNAVRRLAQDGFRLGVAEGGSVQEPITHSVRLVLVDQHGMIRGYYDATDAQATRRLQQDVRGLLAMRPTP